MGLSPTWWACLAGKVFGPAGLYAKMFLIRWVEEEIARRYPDGMMRTPVHFSIGQEAAAVGVIAVLNELDQVFGGHRSHSHYLAKGGSVERLIAELYGKATGCCGGRGGSMHIVDESVGFMGAFPIVGDAVSIATGAALAFSMDGSGRRAIVFSGDAVPETGQFWESLNFAALHKLPILYVVEDNHYATQTPLAQRQPTTSLGDRVSGFMPYQGLGDHEVADVAARTASLLSSLPALLHIQTYRYRKHVGPEYDWDMGYRSREEVEAHMEHDPVARAGRELLGRGHGPEVERIEQDIRRQVAEAFEKAEAVPWPEAA